MIRSQVEISLESQHWKHEVEHDHEPLLSLVIQKGENENHYDFLYQSLYVGLGVGLGRSIRGRVEVLVEGQSDQEADNDIKYGAYNGYRSMYNVDSWPALKVLFE